MTAKESLNQFKWYLEEYSLTLLTRQASVARCDWGCCELLSTVANFLNRPIYVLGYDPAMQQTWACSQYRPCTITHANKLYKTSQQINLTLDQCIEAIRLAKTQDTCKPLVLRYWGEHYSAYVHTQSPHGAVSSASTETSPSSAMYNRVGELGGACPPDHHG